MERMIWTEPAGSRLEMRPFVTASDQALGRLIVAPPPGVSAECYKREEDAAGERRASDGASLWAVCVHDCVHSVRVPTAMAAPDRKTRKHDGAPERPVGAS